MKETMADITPKTAFVVDMMGRFPQLITADKERGRLTDFGVESYGEELRKLIGPIVRRLKPEVNESSKKYYDQLAEWGHLDGICFVELNDAERTRFLEILREDPVFNQKEHLEKCISTRITF